MDYIGKKVAVIRLCMTGNTPDANDRKYTGKALDTVVTIKHRFEDGFYLTDFFMPEFMTEKNDYCHYGFLVLDEHCFSIVGG